MSIYRFDDRVSFDLPAGYLHITERNDEGVLCNYIATGRFTNDEGNTDYRFRMIVDLSTYDPVESDGGIKPGDLIETLADRFGDDAKRIRLQGSPETVLVTRDIELSLFGITMRTFVIFALIRYADWACLKIGVAARVEDEGPNTIASLFENVFDVLKAFRMDGKPLPLGRLNAVSLQQGLDYVDDDTHDITQNFFSLFDDADGESGSHIELTRVTPDPKLYPHYQSIRTAGGLGMFGVPIAINATGTEYEFLPLSRLCSDDNVDAETAELYERIVAKDAGDYTLDREASRMAELFHVSEEAFDHAHDRESELAEGYMHRAYMMSGLRSFAWTLADYCEENGYDPAELDVNTLLQITDFVADADWLNYDGESYCTGICAGSDLHAFFVPDRISYADRRKLLPSDEDHARVERMQSNFAGFREILNEIHSLDALRVDLAYLYPAVETLWEQLKADRDYDTPLIGNAADIVYAWCALALAAKEPFFSEDGPMNCYFTHSSEIDAAAAERHAEWEAQEQQPIGQATAEWWDEYGAYIEKNPSIQIKGKLFVFSGITLHGFEKEHPVVQEMIAQGGEYRTTVSGKTDYLVVDPKYAGKSKAAAALTQMEKGKGIRIIHIDDLKRALGMAVTGETREYKTPVHESRTAASIPPSTPTVPPVPSAKPTVSVKAQPVRGTVVSKQDCESDFLGNLTAYFGSETEIILPDDITGIGKGAFSYDESITSVVIPEGVTSINNYAFCDCKNLKTVVLPSTLTTIGDLAFSSCSKLQSVVLPSTVRFIGGGAFSECESLTEMQIPDGVTEIPEGVFQDCKALKTVWLSNTLQNIGDFAFSGCESLAGIHIPKGVESIGQQAFSFCKKLETVTLPDTLRLIGESCFSQCDLLKDLCIPESVERIEEGAFSSCKSLETVTLPSTLRALGDSAFGGCNNLKEVVSLVVTGSFSEDAFRASFNLECVTLSSAHPAVTHAFKNARHIVVAEGVTAVDEEAFDSFRSLESVMLPSSLKTIGSNAFAFCGNLSEIIIPEGVTEVAWDAFFSCKQLKDLHVPASVVFDGGSAFLGCDDITIHTVQGSAADCYAKENGIKTAYDYRVSAVPSAAAAPVAMKVPSIPAATAAAAKPAVSVKAQPVRGTVVSKADCKINKNGTLIRYYGKETEIILPDGISKIGGNAFVLEKNITSVVIPEGVSSIGRSTFSDCRNLKNIVLPNTLTTIEDNAFWNCEKLETVILPNTLKRIGNSAFSDCRNLKNIVLPNTLTTIEDNAFWNCEKLETVILPNTLTTIGNNAFSYCEKLETVILPSTLKRIGNSAFSHCRNLKNIVLPNTLTTIEDFAFWNCEKLETVILPNTLTTIGNKAFWNCEKLETVILPSTLERIGNNAFCGCHSLTSVVIPESCWEIGDDCFMLCKALEDLYIPDSVISIGNYAFSTHNGDMTIHTVRGSKAECYAKENYIRVAYDYDASQQG